MMAPHSVPDSSAPYPPRPPVVERIACPDCGLMQVLPPQSHGEVAECDRCARVLAGRATGRVGAPLALSVAAVLLLIPASLAPLMTVYSYGAQRQTLLPSGAAALWHDGFPALAVLVGLFSLALPCVYLLLLIWVLWRLQRGRRARVGPAFRWAKHLRPWVMLEVFLIGGFVAYSRINVLTAVDVGVGGWSLLGATLVMLVALTQLDERTVWEMLRPATARAGGAQLIGCTICDFIVPQNGGQSHCPRCHAELTVRKPHSLTRTAALVVAGYLLYIPANLLPVLTTVRFGRVEHNTILSGVVELARNDLWPLAVIVFVASIVLPLLKLCSLTWMLIATRARSGRFLLGRTRLYRTIDTVGRWSNIDVFAVGVLVALLQFGELTTVHAGEGLLAFAAVVIITMLATAGFDARLMWDAARPRNG